MNLSQSEPRLGEILADPVIQAVMLADHVDPEELKATLWDMAQRMRPSRLVPYPASGQATCCGGAPL